MIANDSEVLFWMEKCVDGLLDANTMANLFSISKTEATGILNSLFRRGLVVKRCLKWSIKDGIVNKHYAYAIRR